MLLDLEKVVWMVSWSLDFLYLDVNLKNIVGVRDFFFDKRRKEFLFENLGFFEVLIRVVVLFYLLRYIFWLFSVGSRCWLVLGEIGFFVF